jgi:hypothetical protein
VVAGLDGGGPTNVDMPVANEPLDAAPPILPPQTAAPPAAPTAIAPATRATAADMVDGAAADPTVEDTASMIVVGSASAPPGGATTTKATVTLPDRTSMSVSANNSDNINNVNGSTTGGPSGGLDQFTIIGASVAGGVALIAIIVCVSCSIYYARRDRKKDLRTLARGSARSSAAQNSTRSTPTPGTASSGKNVSRNGTVIGTNDLLAAGTGVSSYSQTAYDRVPSELGSDAALLGHHGGNNNYAVLNRQKTGVAAGYEGVQVLEQANAQQDLVAHGYGGARVLERANEAPYKALTLADGASTTGLPTLEL